MPTRWEEEYIPGTDPEWEAYLERARTGQFIGHELFRLSPQGDPTTGEKLREEHAFRSELEGSTRGAGRQALRKGIEASAGLPKGSISLGQVGSV